MAERRDDVGTKIMYAILTAVISVFLTLIFMKTYATAEQACLLSNDVKKDVAVLQQCVKDISRRLDVVDDINKKLDKVLGVK